MAQVLLIDLSSIAHPLWHTSASDPDPNATSTKTLARVRALASGQPHVAICCDSGRSFRRDINAAYKAQREAAPAALTNQIQTAQELLAGDGFPVWSVKGFEADDLIASATALALAEGHEVLIASADKDLLQLVGPKVRVKRLTDGSIWDAATVAAKLGVNPDQVLDYLSLVGDGSDNVKGADGIGPKKAADLLKKYGNLEDLYANLTNHGTQFTPALATSLRAFEPRMAEVRSLIALRTDIALPISELFAERLAEPPLPEDEETMTDAPLDPVTPATPPAAEPQGEPAKQPEAAPAAPAAAVQRPQARQAEAMPAPPAGELPSMGLAARPFEQQLEPQNFGQVAWLADQMHKARLFSAYGTPQAVMSTILAGRELGLSAMASLRGFHIIENKPTLAADLIRALVLRSQKCEYFRCTERSAERATFVTKRRDEAEISLTFTIEEGRVAFGEKRDGWDKSGWGKNPADMLVARAGAKLARLVYPDVIHGFYAPSEIDDSRTE